MSVANSKRKRVVPEIRADIPLAKRPKPTAEDKPKVEAKKTAAKPNVNGVKKAKESPKAKTAAKPAVSKKAPAAKPATKAREILNQAPTQRLEVLACGEGGNGELGLGPKATDVKRPRLNAFLNPDSVGVVQVAAGGMHCVALTAENKILTWGVSDEGALGRDAQEEGKLKDMDGDSDSEDDEVLLNSKESTPLAIEESCFPEGTKFVQVAAGDSASFALTDTGSVYGWGTFRVSFPLSHWQC
jgi:regulator of chromosome condensation